MGSLRPVWGPAATAHDTTSGQAVGLPAMGQDDPVPEKLVWSGDEYWGEQLADLRTARPGSASEGGPARRRSDVCSLRHNVMLPVSGSKGAGLIATSLGMLQGVLPAGELKSMTVAQKCKAMQNSYREQYPDMDWGSSNKIVAHGDECVWQSSGDLTRCVQRGKKVGEYHAVSNEQCPTAPTCGDVDWMRLSK